MGRGGGSLTLTVAIDVEQPPNPTLQRRLLLALCSHTRPSEHEILRSATLKPPRQAGQL